VPLDMLDRLILDPGTRTLGELFQEREWAVSEIRRLLHLGLLLAPSLLFAESIRVAAN